MKRDSKTKISVNDFKLIMGEDYNDLNLLIDSSYCVKCVEHQTSIVDYEIFLNNLQDVILEGKCKKCGGFVARYIETGENQKKADIAKHVAAINKKFKIIKLHK